MELRLIDAPSDIRAGEYIIINCPARPKPCEFKSPKESSTVREMQEVGMSLRTWATGHLTNPEGLILCRLVMN